MIRESCLVCNSNNLSKVIDLGMHPFADTFIPESKKDKPDIIYPLVCDLCNTCGHIQAEYETPPLERYSQVDYSYTSSNSGFSRKHWEDFAVQITNEINLSPNSFVVEIGSNDGYLTAQFLKKGNKVLGVDPSPYMANLAKERNVETFVGLFNEEIAEKIKREKGKADLIIANNVYNHADNPVEFTKAVSNLLTDSGCFVFEQPYWPTGIKQGKFDQIYHEHVSYFTVRSASALLAKAGMKIKSAKVVDYHGGSLRIIAQKREAINKDSQEEKQMIKEEFDAGMFNLETYKLFMDRLHKQRSAFLQEILKIKESGNPIIAVGAPAKGNTFLNFYRLDYTLIDYVTDSSPHKKGKYTPATRIPIVGDEIFAKFNKPYALLLSWNLAHILNDSLLRINPNIEFISPDKQ